jgi:hypothetical protein
MNLSLSLFPQFRSLSAVFPQSCFSALPGVGRFHRSSAVFLCIRWPTKPTTFEA